MSVTLWLLVAGLFVWMFLCGWCGYLSRFLLFVGVLLLGLGLNTVWMVTALDAAPLRGPAITAHFAATLYGIGSFGSGWLIGRIVRQFRATRVAE